MKTKLPMHANRRRWVYTCRSAHYHWQTTIVANSIKEARLLGYREARRVMGNHAVIITDKVEPFIGD